MPRMLEQSGAGSLTLPSALPGPGHRGVRRAACVAGWGLSRSLMLTCHSTRVVRFLPLPVPAFLGVPCQTAGITGGRGPGGPPVPSLADCLSLAMTLGELKERSRTSPQGSGVTVLHRRLPESAPSPCALTNVFGGRTQAERVDRLFYQACQDLVNPCPLTPPIQSLLVWGSEPTRSFH